MIGRKRVLLGSVCISVGLLLAACQAFMTDAQKVESELVALDPQALAQAECVGQALETDPNITNPIADIEFVGEVVACFEQADGGSSISADGALSLVKTNRPAAAKRALAKRAKVSAH